MEEILLLVNGFEKRNNMSIAFTMYGDGSYSVNEFWDNESLDGGNSVAELKEYLIKATYKKDENERCISPCERIDNKITHVIIDRN